MMMDWRMAIGAGGIVVGAFCPVGAIKVLLNLSRSDERPCCVPCDRKNKRTFELALHHHAIAISIVPNDAGQTDGLQGNTSASFAPGERRIVHAVLDGSAARAKSW